MFAADLAETSCGAVEQGVRKNTHSRTQFMTGTDTNYRFGQFGCLNFPKYFHLNDQRPRQGGSTSFSQPV